MLGGKLSQNVHHNQHLSPETMLPKEHLLDLMALLIFPLFQICFAKAGFSKRPIH